MLADILRGALAGASVYALLHVTFGVLRLRALLASHALLRTHGEDAPCAGCLYVIPEWLPLADRMTKAPALIRALGYASVGLLWPFMSALPPPLHRCAR